MGVAERREREKRGREELIVNTAKRLFKEQGFDNVSMLQIAEEAELAKGTLYIYFQSKQELLYKILEPVLIKHNEALAALVDNFEGSTEELFNKVIDFLYNWNETEEESYNLVSRYEAQEYKKLLSEEKQQRLLSLMRQNLSNIQKMIEKGIAEGVFEYGNSKVLTVILWNIFSSVLQYQENRIVAGGNDYRRSTLDTAMKVFLRGIKKN